MFHPGDDTVARIAARLREAGITQHDLHTDLLDHICCKFEALGDEVPFEEAWQHATAEISINGELRRLEEERTLLLNHQTAATMSRILFPLGFLTTFMFSTGILFRMTHWPGSHFFIGVGSLLLIAISIVILARTIQFSRSHSAGHLVRNCSGVLAALLIAVGSLFKIFHFPGADMQVVLGMTLLNVIFLPLFFHHLYQRSLKKVMIA